MAAKKTRAKTEKKKFEAAEVFKYACYNQSAANILSHSWDTKPLLPGIDEKRNSHLGFPQMVLWAFATELFFKALILIEKGKPVRGHSLVDLWTDVSPESKMRIRKIFFELCQQTPHFYSVEESMDLDACIVKNDNVFEDWRYLFENNLVEGEVYFGLAELMVAVKIRCFEIKNEWEEMVRGKLPPKHPPIKK